MVLDKLKTLIGKVMQGYNIDLDAITMASTLKGDLGFSSISMLLMAIAIEEEFHITIHQLDGDTFLTVGDACDYIERALAAKK
jgi:acyl carrier protein